MLSLLGNLVEGTLGVAINVAKLPVAAVAVVADDGDMLEETGRAIAKNLKKIGDDK